MGDLDKIMTPVRMVLGIAGVICALIVVSKVLGVAAVRGAVMEWAATAVACSLAGR